MKTLFLALLFCSVSVFAMPAQILLIRHGEKPDTGNELSTKGWQRAKALPQLFESRFKTPVALYAMNPSKSSGSIRAIQTLKYVSEKLNVPINNKFTRDDIKSLVNDIQNNKDYNGKTILICWEHSVLINIAQMLGVTVDLKWPGSQFDRVWVLDFDGPKMTQFQNLPQSLLPGDSK